MNMKTEETRDACLAALRDKKGRDLTVIDLQGVTSVADYFIVCTGDASIHIRTLADAVADSLREMGERPWHREGYSDKRWILLDYVDVVVHIFSEELRELYDLERLWGDAKITRVEEG